MPVVHSSIRLLSRGIALAVSLLLRLYYKLSYAVNGGVWIQAAGVLDSKPVARLPGIG
jgi:hypothetical protein